MHNVNVNTYAEVKVHNVKVNTYAEVKVHNVNINTYAEVKVHNVNINTYAEVKVHNININTYAEVKVHNVNINTYAEVKVHNGKVIVCKLCQGKCVKFPGRHALYIKIPFNIFRAIIVLSYIINRFRQQCDLCTAVKVVVVLFTDYQYTHFSF